MSLALLLLPAVGGYWFVTHFNYTQFQAVRESGYHILFRSVLVGILWHWVAVFAVWFLDTRDVWIIPTVIEQWATLFPETFAIETVAAIALGVVSPYFLNLFYSRQRGYRRAAQITGDHMELLISDALQKQAPIEISLRSRKFYIGFVTGHNATRHSDTAVSMIPVYSGHRTEDKLHLVIDIDYDHTVRRFVDDVVEREHRNPDDFRVVIPVGEIVSARQFDLDVYRAFQIDFASAAAADDNPDQPR